MYAYRKTIFIGLLALAILHGHFDKFIKIDGTSLILIGLALVVFYLPVIRKFKWNDFEISTHEVTEVAEVVQMLPAAEDELTESRETAAMRNLLANDPTLALAQLRITIEKRLVAITKAYKPQLLNPGKGHPILSRLLFELYRQKALDIETYIAAKDVLNITSRAIHGEPVSESNAVKIIELGEIVVQELDNVLERPPQVKTKHKEVHS